MKFYLPVLSTLEKAVQDGLVEVGEATLVDSNRRAPEDSGELKAAGFVHAEDLSVQVGYDHPKGYPYIARQHEDMDYQHPGGGGPKFLESAEKAITPQVGSILARHVRKALG